MPVLEDRLLRHIEKECVFGRESRKYRCGGHMRDVSRRMTSPGGNGGGGAFYREGSISMGKGEGCPNGGELEKEVFGTHAGRGVHIQERDIKGFYIGGHF